MSKFIVFCCSRADFTHVELQKEVELIELPCTGRISLSLLVGAIARGADGVLVLGRHQQSCRLDGAEDYAKSRTEAASELVGLCGIATERIRFIEPAPGANGPKNAVDTFVLEVSSLGRSHIALRDDKLSDEFFAEESLDNLLALADWLTGDRLYASPVSLVVLRRWLTAHGLSQSTPATSVLLTSDLPRYDLAARELFRPLRIDNLYGSALVALNHLGFRVGLAAERGIGNDECFCLGAKDCEDVSDSSADCCKVVDAFIFQHADRFPRPEEAALIACEKEDAAGIEALGYRAKIVEFPTFSPSFSINSEEITRIRSFLATIGEAKALYLSSIDKLLQWAMILRQGAWQSTSLFVLSAAQLAQLSIAKLPLTASFIEHPFRAGEDAHWPNVPMISCACGELTCPTCSSDSDV